jgi:hypothetical protein
MISKMNMSRENDKCHRNSKHTGADIFGDSE